MRQVQLQDDEIDLFDLILILWKRKLLISVVTLLITAIGTAYVYSKTPIYEAKALIEMGTYTSDKGDTAAIADATAMEKRLHLLFIEIDGTLDNRTADITSISAVQGLKTFLEIKSESTSNEYAKGKIMEVLTYIQEKHKKSLDLILSNRQVEYNSISAQLAKIGFKTDQQATLLYKLLERKNQLETLLLPQNYRNTDLVGDVLLHKSPTRPKKNLGIAVSFAIGLMTSIVLALLLNLIKGAKQQTK